MDTTTRNTLGEGHLIGEIPRGYERLFNRTWLYALYVDARASVNRIGSIVGVADSMVETALRNAGIALREVGTDRRFTKLRDTDYLVDALTVRGLCQRDVAREVGCSEQVVGEAIRWPDNAEALAAAGWAPGQNAKKNRGGRKPDVAFPSDDETVEIVAHVAASHPDGWAARSALLSAAGLSESQYHSWVSHLGRLVDSGRLVTATVRRALRGRPAICYRVSDVVEQ